MKTDKKTIKAVKYLLKDDSHSKHHLKIELTKNLLPHIFEEEPKEENFVITKEQIEYLSDLHESATRKLTEWFPSAFVEDKKESEIISIIYKSNNNLTK